MKAGISRRDFLNGVALVIGASVTPACSQCGGEHAANADHPAPEKPVATPTAAVAPTTPRPVSAMLGSTDASYAAAHALRDGKKFPIGELPVEDSYDLVVIGSGISGLAAAHYYRKRKPAARILILENHDDFGGHARRCEMQVDGRLILGYGGSESIQSPGSLWSAGALALLTELGVDLKRFETSFDRGLYPGLGLSRGMLFTKEAFGVDKLVTGDPTHMVADDIPADKLNARPVAAFINDFPLPAAARAALTALYEAKRDVLAGKSIKEKQALLASISYREFLTKYWGLDEATANVFQKRSHDFFAIGIDGVPALDAAATGYPGMDGLGLPRDPEAQAEMDEPYIYHFPDGNASLARLLVRQLIPAVAAGKTMDDVVSAHFDYSQLDVAATPIRLRLNSTAVVVSGARGNKVDIGYVREGTLRRVQAHDTIHAGYNMMLPYMMEELKQPQRDALHAGVKGPLVYAKVAVRNWRPWVKMGVHEVTNPMGFFSRIKLDYPVSLGGYQFAKTPDEPIGLHMVHVPTPSGTGADQRTAWRMGRGILFGMQYAQFEEKIFDELTRIVGPGGFDARRDITAISIYRWGHGYAYGFNSLYDKPQEPEVPVIAHARVGHVAIANSDAGWSAYAHSAIDEAARAVKELVRA